MVIIATSFKVSLGASYFVTSSNPANKSASIWWGDNYWVSGDLSVEVIRLPNKSIVVPTPGVIHGHYDETTSYGVPLDRLYIELVKNSPSGITWEFGTGTRTVSQSSGTTPVNDSTRYGYTWVPFTSSGLIGDIKTNFLINIPSSTPDGTYNLGRIQFEATSTAVPRTNIVLGDYSLTIKTLPDFIAADSNIDFGRVPIDTTTSLEAFGRISVQIGSGTNFTSGNFSASYPSTVTLTNSSDGSTVSANIALLDGSETGSLLNDESFLIASNKSIYVRATLPASEITNKSTGTYSGNLTISVDYN